MTRRRASVLREVAADLFAAACLMAAFIALTLWAFAISAVPA